MRQVLPRLLAHIACLTSLRSYVRGSPWCVKPLAHHPLEPLERDKFRNQTALSAQVFRKLPACLKLHYHPQALLHRCVPTNNCQRRFLRSLQAHRHRLLLRLPRSRDSHPRGLSVAHHSRSDFSPRHAPNKRFHLPRHCHPAVPGFLDPPFCLAHHHARVLLADSYFHPGQRLPLVPRRPQDPADRCLRLHHFARGEKSLLTRQYL